MEGVLAAFAQFDNDVRSDRTRAGMKAALELGRWVFLAPIGYLNARGRWARACSTIRTVRRSLDAHLRVEGP
jgi:DNA invertase Pin-like site-specific DNA recombinase